MTRVTASVSNKTFDGCPILERHPALAGFEVVLYQHESGLFGIGLVSSIGQRMLGGLHEDQERTANRMMDVLDGVLATQRMLAA